MTEWVGNHLWQSTVFASGAAALAFTLRRHRAEVRYWVWLAASVKFLIPFSALAAAGTWAARTLAPEGPAQPHRLAVAVSAVTQPFRSGEASLDAGALLPAAAPGIAAAAGWGWMLAACWAAGATSVLAIWTVRWLQVAAIARRAVPMAASREALILRTLERRFGRTRPLPLLQTDSVLEPGIFGIVRPVLLWPASIAERLDAAHVESVLAHELSHLQRRDNLAAAVHTMVQALFWFHPLVWWLGDRLVAEREQACDEAVIGLGGDRAVYAQSILKTCEFCLAAPQACVAGVTGADLRRRIESIMRRPAAAALTRRGKALMASAATASVAIPIAVGVVAPRPITAIVQVTQTEIRGGSNPAPAPAPPPDLRFEVASVKPNKSGEARVQIGMQPGGRFTAVNVPLRVLIRNAYQAQDFQLVGAPDWTGDERFDITARAEGDVAPVPIGTVGPFQIMLRNLLADRFKLVVRQESREMPIYALVVARSDKRLGPQLQRSTVDCQALAAARGRGGAPPPAPQQGERPMCGMRIGPGMLTAGGVSVRQLASSLGQFVQRVVVDRTGLDGNYDMDLKWTPDQMPQGAPAAAKPAEPIGDPNNPSLFTALQEQLGLKLEGQRGPVEVIVVQTVDRPIPD
jgi:uncharacterized protein (TIGR03435 family)